MACNHCDCALTRGKNGRTYGCFLGKEAGCFQGTHRHRWILLNSKEKLEQKMQYLRVRPGFEHRDVHHYPIASRDLMTILRRGGGNELWRGIICPRHDDEDREIGQTECCVLAVPTSRYGFELLSTLAWLRRLYELDRCGRGFESILDLLESGLAFKDYAILSRVQEEALSLAGSLPETDPRRPVAILAVELSNVFQTTTNEPRGDKIAKAGAFLSMAWNPTVEDLLRRFGVRHLTNPDFGDAAERFSRFRARRVRSIPPRKKAARTASQ